jgi:hypothetical protein
VVDDNGVVMAIDFDEQERRRRAVEEARDELQDLDAFDDVMEVRELLQTEDPVSRWRREGEATKREQEQAHAAMKAEEARIIRQHQQAAERAAELPEVWVDAIAAFVAEFVREKISKLERRLDALETKQQRSVDDGEVVDLPSPLIRKVRINAA